MQGWKRSIDVLSSYFDGGTLIGQLTTEPFVNDYTERVLVTGGAWVGFNLLRRHVAHCPGDIFCTLIERTLGNNCNAKVAEHNLVTPPKQDILRLNITVNHLFIMSILQGVCNVRNIHYNRRQREARSFRVAIS